MSRLKAILAIQDMDSMRLLRANLRAAGYDIATAPSGADILDSISDDYGDILVVGESLPDVAGLEFIRLLRMRSNIPVVMMGQAEGSAGVVAALRAGADDFLAYPYSTDEFFARVGAVMRRAGRESFRAEDGKKRIGGLTIDMGQRQVIVKGKASPLTPTEFKLLVYMAERPDQIVSHEELLAHVWGADFVNHVHYLRVGIGRLRQKIEKDPSSPIYLVTCSGVGYMLQDVANR
jgi:DNA-binding response OmpR family regulator